MKFSLSETQLFLYIFEKSSSQNQNEIYKTNLQHIITQLNEGAYIKGRLLHFLYTEIKNATVSLNNDQILLLENVLKRVKFKATPR